MLMKKVQNKSQESGRKDKLPVLEGPEALFDHISISMVRLLLLAKRSSVVHAQNALLVWIHVFILLCLLYVLSLFIY